MPGIIGKVGLCSGETLSQEIETMARSMLHERFYDVGSYVSARSAVGLGVVSHKDSFAGGRPIWNAGRNICLVFAGECFGLDDLVSDYPSRQRSAGGRDASLLVDLYEQSGLSFLEKLNGIFSGALADFRSNQVFLFNDRYGLGRIYFHEGGNGFYFASEAKALLSVLPELRRLDYTALAEQFSCGCALQGRTLFSGISLLPGGSIWTIGADGEIRKGRYFDSKDWETQAPLDNESFYGALKETFSRILPRYFQGMESLGMSLTGGLDGRMIMACAPKKATFPCYTFGGSYRECADVWIARKVARVRGNSHQVLPVNGTFLKQFPALAEKSVHISDGTMDVSGAVELYANRLAREIAPVRLTGNYGSEILRRNVAFRPGKDFSKFLSADFAGLVHDAGATYGNARAGDTLSFIAFGQVPWHHYARLSLEQSQLTVRSPYLDNDLVKIAYLAPTSQQTSPLPALRLIADCNPALARIPTDRGLLLAPWPFTNRLARAWQETSVRAEYVYDYGMPQWLARIDHALAPLHLDRLFLGRHKFYHFRVWYRDQLGPYVKEILLDSLSRSRDYVDGPALERLINSHADGLGNYTAEIHKLLSIELLHRTLLKSGNVENPKN